VTPSLSLAQSSSGQGGNRSVPKKERETHGVDFRVVNFMFHDACRDFLLALKGIVEGNGTDNCLDNIWRVPIAWHYN